MEELTTMDIATKYQVSIPTVGRWVKNGLKFELRRNELGQPYKAFKEQDIDDYLGDKAKLYKIENKEAK